MVPIGCINQWAKGLEINGLPFFLPQAELATGSKRRVMAFSLLLFFPERSEIAPRKKEDTNHTAEIKTVQCPGGSGEIDLSRV